MKLIRIVGLIAITASVAGSASAVDCSATRPGFVPPTTFSANRQAHSGIDDAIGAMPSSDLNGTINRLSALYSRSTVDDLLIRDGECGNIPENVLRNLRATFADLADDLDLDNLAGLSDEQALFLFQLVRTYAVLPMLSLHDGNTFCYPTTTCVPNPEAPLGPPICTINYCPVGGDPAVYDDINAIIGVLNPLWTDIRDQAASDPDFAGNPTPASLDGNNFASAIPTMVFILGVESIDD